MEQATAGNAQPTAADEHRVKEVSVICTARNAAATIEATIRSILAQDFQNWEMILVDDGSTDDTVGIVNGFAQSDSRIRLVSTPGVGRGRALNLALAEAKTDLVANIDADDEAHPCRLRRQIEAMERHPQFAILATEWFRVYDAGRPNWPGIDANALSAVEDVTGSLAVSNPICHSSVMMRKAAILELGGYDEMRRFVFDYDLWVRSAAAGLRLGRIQLPLVAKRIHPGQHFLHSAPLRYRLAGFQVRLRAIRVLGIRMRDVPMIGLRVVWVLLPLKVRHTVTKIGAGWRIGNIRLR